MMIKKVLHNLYSVADIAIIKLISALVFIAFVFYVLSVNTKALVLSKATSHARQVIDIAFEREKYIVNFSNSLLQTLSDVDPILTLDSTACNNFLVDYLRVNQTYLLLGVADAQGIMVCASTPFDKGLSITDRRYFQQVMKTGKFSLGDYQIGKVSKKPSLHFAYPIKDDVGNTKGIIFNSLSVDWFKDMIHGLHMPNNQWEFLIVDYDGTVIASNNENKVGTLGVSSKIFSYVLSGSGTGATLIQDNKGNKKVYLSRPLSENESAASLYMIVSVDMRGAYKKIDTALLIGFFAVSAVFLLYASSRRS